MPLHGKHVLIAMAIIFLALTATACKDSSQMTGPSAAPTPTPTPVPIAGNWSGTFQTNLPCAQPDSGTSTASLSEAGSSVTGTVVARSGVCGFSVSIQAVRSGNQLTGTAADGDYIGQLGGALLGAELVLTIGDLSKDGAEFLVGGTVYLHRP